MSQPVRRRLDALRRVLLPEPPPDFSGVTEEERLLWHLKKYGLAKMLSEAFESEDREQIEAEAEDASATSEVNVEVKFEAPTAPEAAASAEPPQVESKPPPAVPEAPVAAVWWEEQLRYRPRRLDHPLDVEPETWSEPWEEDDLAP
jgi:hypothetical protein